MKRFQTLITLALIHIKSQQSPDGSFIHLSSVTPDDFTDATPRRTTFFASNILACLQNIPDTDHVSAHSAVIRNATAKFLISQKSECWSFNYWVRGTNESPSYPDDFDDTFAALAALVRHDAATINGHALAAIARMLTAREVRVGGPYRTWIVSDDAAEAWHDIDVVVNSTIGYFLSLINVRVSGLSDFIDSAVHNDRIDSPYYPGILHAAYFLSRFYNTANRDSARATLATIITKELLRDGNGKITALELAMAILSLINLGHADMITPVAIDLLASRLECEGFLPYAFCVDPARAGRRYYAGASASTAAFAAAALSRYAAGARGIGNNATDTTGVMPAGYDHIRSLARASCRALDAGLQARAIAQIEKTSDEKITAVAYEFRTALYKSGVIIPIEIADQLSLANLYGWMAYAIYDDVLDGESANPLLPCANFFLRALAEIYFSLNAQIPGVKILFDKTMNCIETANSWEQTYCCIPAQPGAILPQHLPSFDDYQTLADRSIGHGMGPLAELLFAGYGPDSAEYKDVESLFRHYLIARQIHDDAHDWVDDLARGRMNSVSTLIMHDFWKKHPAGAGAAQIADALPRLRTIFWTDTVNSVSDLIIFHVGAARRAREKLRIFDGSDFMEIELRILESGARRAIKERNEALDFLRYYRGSLHLADRSKNR